MAEQRSASETAVLAVIERTPSILRTLTRGFDAKALNTPVDGGWSMATLMAHLIDVDAVGFRQRIGRIVHEDHPFLPSINPGEDADTSDDHAPFAMLLDGFEQARQDSLGWMLNLDPSAFDRLGQHAAAGDISARNVFHWWAIHDLAHIRQATKILQAQFEPHLGNMVGFLDEV